MTFSFSFILRTEAAVLIAINFTLDKICLFSQYISRSCFNKINSFILRGRNLKKLFLGRYFVILVEVAIRVKLSGQLPISLWNLRAGRFATDAQNWKLYHQCNKTIIELYHCINVSYGWDLRNYTGKTLITSTLAKSKSWIQHNIVKKQVQQKTIEKTKWRRSTLTFLKQNFL